jgi:hypothetical protein
VPFPKSLQAGVFPQPLIVVPFPKPVPDEGVRGSTKRSFSATSEVAPFQIRRLSGFASPVNWCPSLSSHHKVHSLEIHRFVTVL